MGLPELGRNLAAMFVQEATRQGDAPLLHAKRDGAWAAWSWARVLAEAQALAGTLGEFGVDPGDRVAIVAENRPEWCTADLAILLRGAVTVPSYTTYTTEDYSYVLEDSGAVALVAAGGAIARRLLPAVAKVSAVQAVVLLDKTEAAPIGRKVVSWAEALASAGAPPPAQPGLVADGGATACIIYTSGTGGRPKGVMLSHANILANIRGVWDLLERYAPNDRAFLSFLPLSHSYEHTVGQFLPIAVGGQIWYAEGVEHLAGNLLEVRPRILPAVPRLFEVFRQRTVQAMERQGGWRAKLFWQAVELGERRYAANGRLPWHLMPLDRLLDRLVRDKVRARFGGRLNAMVCGGGPLNPEIGVFFAALGIPVCHGYGQTETSPVVSVTPPGSCKLDTVGPPLEGVELRIADDGEILVRGDLVMKGYWGDPAATANAIRDGWLHTGDVGSIDAQGYLKITDRKKDIIVLSGGDNIAPQRVEAIIALEPEIGQVVVYGDRRPFLVAILVPSQELRGEIAGEVGLAPDAPTLIAEAPLGLRVDAAMKRANARLSSLERVRRWALRQDSFTIENGLMTPTMKLRRSLIYQAEAPLLESLYTPARETAPAG